MAFVFTENANSGTVTHTRDGLEALREFYVKSDSGGDSQKMLDTEAAAQDSQIIVIGTAHPDLTGLVLKTWQMVPSAAPNHAVLTYTYARPETGGDIGGGRSTPDENGEIWTFNMVSQTTNINTVRLDVNGNPLQKTYDRDTPSGAAKYEPINFDGEQVYGVDVFRPAETVNVSKTYEGISSVAQSYRRTLRRIQNTVNYRRWPSNSEYEKGELLFLGADLSYNIEADTATINYSFMAGQTQENQVFKVWKSAPELDDETVNVTINRVYPFQVVWAPIKAVEFKISDTESVIKYHPDSINVADVYQWADFIGIKLAR